MAIKLHDTMTQKTEDINTIKDGEVSMYHCGPTVYQYQHIGNMRTYVFADILRRTFEYEGYKVKQVINITDVGHLVSDNNEGEDKVEKSARENNKTAKEVTDFYTKIFLDDLKKLNINTTNTLFPHATDNISEQIDIIEKLEKENHTYKTKDGIYFDVSTFPDYGKLGNIDLKGLQAGNRVEFSGEKHTPYDFALWKFSNPEEKRQQEWSSPWGIGFPGWHIECSAMSEKYLGKNFDIHTGGIDHIPVHHNNEIAQSVCANHVPLANIWMHSAFLNWKDRKMSKSDGDFVTLSDLEKQNINPLSYRYFLLQTRYRQPIFFEMEDLEASQTAYHRIKNKIHDILNKNTESNIINIEIESGINDDIKNIIEDDLNTPKLLAYLWDLIKDEKINKNIIEKIDSILGLKLLEHKIIPNNILKLKKERDEARKNRDFKKSDDLRDAIKKLGYQVLDSNDNSEIIPD